MGIGVGRIGLSRDDFMQMTPAEFAAIADAFFRQREEDYRTSWEQARVIACNVLRPHLGKGRGRQSVQRLMPLPWDTEAKARARGKERPKVQGNRDRAREMFERFGFESKI